MARKFCPLSFFSFYVNKEHAQAGGAHHCVEDACAWWDDAYEQCGLKSAVDAFGLMAEGGAVPVRKQQRRERLVAGVSGGMSSTFDKLRKRLPTAGQAPTKKQEPAKEPALVGATPSKNVATNVTQAAPPTPVVTPQKPVTIVTKVEEQKTVKSAAAVVETPNKNSENNLTLPIKTNIKPIANPAETLPPTKVETTPAPAPLPTKAETTPTPVTPPPVVKEPEQDFSDLLNPPAIPLSELPVISAPVEKESLDPILTEPKPEPTPEPAPVVKEPTPEPAPEPEVSKAIDPVLIERPKATEDPMAEILEASKLVPEEPKQQTEWSLPDDLPIPEEFLEKPSDTPEDR